MTKQHNTGEAKEKEETTVERSEAKGEAKKRTRAEDEDISAVKKQKVQDNPVNESAGATSEVQQDREVAPAASQYAGYPLYHRQSGRDSGSTSAAGETIEVRILINAKWMGGLIGKGGSVIKQYRSGSQAFINISNSVPGISERVVTVKSTPEKVMIGLQMVIHNLVTQMVTSAQYYPSDDEKDSKGPHITFLIPNGAIGAVIGKGGTVIKQVRETSGASIKISDDTLPGSTDKSLTLQGTSTQIWTAAQIICQNITASNGWAVQNQPYTPQADGLGVAPSSGGRGSSYPGYPYPSPYGHVAEQPTQVVLPVPTFLVGSIIGKGGKNIQEIRSKSGAMVKIADAKVGAHERMVSITGTAKQHQIALSLIYSKMNAQTGAQTGYVAPQTGPTYPAHAAQAHAAQVAAAAAAAAAQMPAYPGYGYLPTDGTNPYAGYPPQF
eukprot:1330129-Amorphochlora_amoeboformis.AAC.2